MSEGENVTFKQESSESHLRNLSLDIQEARNLGLEYDKQSFLNIITTTTIIYHTLAVYYILRKTFYTYCFVLTPYSF